MTPKSSTKEKKTGLFFGSFNPIHNGHLIVANHMLEYTDLSEIWFVISPHNPLKDKKSLLEDHHRYYMVNLAIEDNYHFRASNIEFGMPKPSYTINTLTYLYDSYPGRDFVLIAGGDILPSLHKWKNYEMILEYYQIYIYPRPGGHKNPYKGHPSISLVDAPMLEISSSFIRDAIKNGKDLRYILPDKVYKYILDMHFYEG